jgi:hypothetical protein
VSAYLQVCGCRHAEAIPTLGQAPRSGGEGLGGWLREVAFRNWHCICRTTPHPNPSPPRAARAGGGEKKIALVTQEHLAGRFDSSPLARSSPLPSPRAAVGRGRGLAPRARFLKLALNLPDPGHEIAGRGALTTRDPD